MHLRLGVQDYVTYGRGMPAAAAAAAAPGANHIPTRNWRAERVCFPYFTSTRGDAWNILYDPLGRPKEKKLCCQREKIWQFFFLAVLATELSSAAAVLAGA